MPPPAPPLPRQVRTLGETVRLDARTKLLNPKWYEGMLGSGYEGVREIQKRLTNTMGWSATSGAVDNWVYDEANSTFIEDPDMAKRLMDTNPNRCVWWWGGSPRAHVCVGAQSLAAPRHASVCAAMAADKRNAARPPCKHPSFRKLVATFLEANGRGYWEADPEKIERLRQVRTAGRGRCLGVCFEGGRRRCRCQHRALRRACVVSFGASNMWPVGRCAAWPNADGLRVPPALPPSLHHSSTWMWRTRSRA